jgi:DNA modification methylase
MDEYINKIICGDCLEVLKDFPDGCVDLVLTDPPYPDAHIERYGYKKNLVWPLYDFDCRQLVFWTAKEEFPLDYSAVHIWDKKTGCGSWYERIFERNGGIEYKVYRHYLINSTVAASYTGDVWTGHPSQKPIALIEELIEEYTNSDDLILDPFCGSGTTCLAAKKLGRRYIGIDISEEYCQIARERLRAVETGVPVKEARQGQGALFE